MGEASHFFLVQDVLSLNCKARIFLCAILKLDYLFQKQLEQGQSFQHIFMTLPVLLYMALLEET